LLYHDTAPAPWWTTLLRRTAIESFFNTTLPPTGPVDGKVYPWSVAHYVNMTSK
ncbi:unnamed protein product, partial [Effrenium voratum]